MGGVGDGGVWQNVHATRQNPIIFSLPVLPSRFHPREQWLSKTFKIKQFWRPHNRVGNIPRHLRMNPEE